MSSMLEQAKKLDAVPSAYWMNYQESLEFVHMAKDGRAFDAVLRAYSYGFLRGRSCEKRTQAKKNKK